MYSERSFGVVFQNSTQCTVVFRLQNWHVVIVLHEQIPWKIYIFFNMIATYSAYPIYSLSSLTLYRIILYRLKSTMGLRYSDGQDQAIVQGVWRDWVRWFVGSLKSAGQNCIWVKNLFTPCNSSKKCFLLIRKKSAKSYICSVRL